MTLHSIRDRQLPEALRDLMSRGHFSPAQAQALHSALLQHPEPGLATRHEILLGALMPLVDQGRNRDALPLVRELLSLGERSQQADITSFAARLLHRLLALSGDGVGAFQPFLLHLHDARKGHDRLQDDPATVASVAFYLQTLGQDDWVERLFDESAQRGGDLDQLQWYWAAFEPALHLLAARRELGSLMPEAVVEPLAPAQQSRALQRSRSLRRHVAEVAGRVNHTRVQRMMIGLEWVERYLAQGSAQALLGLRQWAHAAGRLGDDFTHHALLMLTPGMHRELGHREEALKMAQLKLDWATSRGYARFRIEGLLELAHAEHAAGDAARALGTYGRHVQESRELERRRRSASRLVKDFLSQQPAFARLLEVTQVLVRPRQEGTVARAEQLMQARLGAPLTLREIASTLAISERALQLAFQREHGRSPMDHYRLLRLTAFRADLMQADPHGRHAIHVLRKRYGFEHASTLIRAYRLQFGELPSETLAQLQGRGPGVAGMTVEGAPDPTGMPRAFEPASGSSPRH